MRKLQRELKGDLDYLNKKAIRLIDELALIQGRIAHTKWRLRKLNEATAPIIVLAGWPLALCIYFHFCI